MKKTVVAIFIIALSISAFIFHTNLLTALRALEIQSMEMPFIAALILIGLKILSATLGLPGTPLTLLAGSLFGKLFGTIIALIGNTLGATCAFLLARYVLRDYVSENILTKYPKIKLYDEKIRLRGFTTVFALRLIPLFPFNMLNFLLGITSVSLKNYILASFLGMIPGTFIFVYFGESLRMLSPLNIGLAILGIIILIFLGREFEKRF